MGTASLAEINPLVVLPEAHGHVARDLVEDVGVVGVQVRVDVGERTHGPLDLEFLLMQIARLVDERDATEREVVREGLDESTVLPRLRQLAPVRRPARCAGASPRCAGRRAG